MADKPSVPTRAPGANPPVSPLPLANLLAEGSWYAGQKAPRRSYSLAEAEKIAQGVRGRVAPRASPPHNNVERKARPVARVPGCALTGPLQAHRDPAEALAEFVGGMVAGGVEAGERPGRGRASRPPARTGASPAPYLDIGTHDNDRIPPEHRQPPEDIWQGIPPWRVRKTQFLDGDAAFVARRVSTRECQLRCMGAAHSRKSVTVYTDEEVRQRKEENAARAAERARRTLRHAVKQLRLDRMFTFTTRECISDRDKFLSYWARFLRIVREAKGRHWLKYQCVLELQERGAYHAHVAVRGYKDILFLRQSWLKALGGGVGKDSPGSVQISPWSRGAVSRRKLIAYMVKYMGKDIGAEAEELAYRKRLMGSKYPAPVVEEWLFPGDQFASVEDLIIGCLGKFPDGPTWRPRGDDTIVCWETSS